MKFVNAIAPLFSWGKMPEVKQQYMFYRCTAVVEFLSGVLLVICSATFLFRGVESSVGHPGSIVSWEIMMATFVVGIAQTSTSLMACQESFRALRGLITSLGAVCWMVIAYRALDGMPILKQPFIDGAVFGIALLMTLISLVFANNNVEKARRNKTKT